MRDTEKLIESLGLTAGEERELRRLVDLGPPTPKNRLQRLLYSPLEDIDAVIALIVLLALLAVFSYGVWKLSSHFRPFNDVMTTLVMFFLIFSIFLEKRRRDGLIRKLYRALEGEATSNLR